MTAAVVGRAAGAAGAGKAVGKARPSTRPSSALTESTGELAQVGKATPGTYTTTPPPAPKKKTRAKRPPSQPAPAPAQEPAQTPPAPGNPQPPPAAPEGSGWFSGLSLPSLPRGGGTVDTGAGFLLGLLVWAWIVLPYFKGGLPETKKVLMAKFFNKAPDGSWLK